MGRSHSHLRLSKKSDPSHHPNPVTFEPLNLMVLKASIFWIFYPIISNSQRTILGRVLYKRNLGGEVGR